MRLHRSIRVVNEYLKNNKKLKGWIMFFKKKSSKKEDHKRKDNKPYLNCSFTYGDNAVVLTDENRNQITVVDERGNIQNFPGVQDKELWINELKSGDIFPKVRYRTEFYSCADFTWKMLWEIQPDGRYWEDSDGFGGSSDQEIILYSYFDKRGIFLHEFRVYSIGIKEYFKDE